MNKIIKVKAVYLTDKQKFCSWRPKHINLASSFFERNPKAIFWYCPNCQIQYQRIIKKPENK